MKTLLGDGLQGHATLSPEKRLPVNFPPEEFAARRGRLFDRIGAEAHALLQGAPPVQGFQVFRQTNQFYYCCGVEMPQAYLLLDGSARRATLFLPQPEEKQSSAGATLSLDQADLIKERTGLDEVCGIDHLSGRLANVSVLYTPHSPAEGRGLSRDEMSYCKALADRDPWDGRPTREQHFIELLKTRLPRAEIRDLSPILDEMRAIKSPREIDVMREAGRLCALGVAEGIRATRPGMIEYQLAAIASRIFLENGAMGEGYRPIVACGANIAYAHYAAKNCEMKDGDWVLMDMAPDYGYYTSDIGRMWPVNGTYAPWQRELYGYMVEYHKTVLARIRPGVTADEVLDESAAVMAKIVEKTAFSKPIYEQAAIRTLEFRGHLSHPVGMAVHDTGGYRGKPLSPGVVFTVDPQMWVPEEHLYVRVEDTVAVTETGIENFTVAAPLELDDVEASMRRESRFKDTLDV